MLTSGDHPEDGQRCQQLGIAAYLLKPVKQSELLEALEMALGLLVPAKATGAVAAASAPTRKLRVLLAEDSVVNQKLAVALLERQGHTVTVATNGREALAATERQEFDLVLMDVQMPEMDGFEATQAIRMREHQTGRRLPIIAVTAHALKGDDTRCLAAGMDAYISKPIRAHELHEAIARVVPAACAT
jgi:CheY-like chemotaxis protein